MDDRITISDFVTFVLLWIKRLIKKWKVITLFIIIGTLLGFLVYYLSPIKYVAETAFVVSETDNNTPSPLEQLGLSTGEQTGLFEGDNLVWLYTTNNMIQDALKTIVYDGKDSTTLIAWICKIDPKIEERKKDLGISNLNIRSKQNSRPQQALLNYATNRIKEKYLEVGYIRKTEQVIFVKVMSLNEDFSIFFNQILVQRVNEYYVTTKSQKERTQVQILTEKLQEVENSTLKSITKAAKEADEIPYANPTRSVLFDNAEKSKLDLQSTSSLYIQLSQRLEAAKIQLEQVTPLIQIIETSSFPLKIERPNKFLTSFIGGILFFLLAIVVIYLRSLKIKFPKEDQ